MLHDTARKKDTMNTTDGHPVDGDGKAATYACRSLHTRTAIDIYQERDLDRDGDRQYCLHNRPHVRDRG